MPKLKKHLLVANILTSQSCSCLFGGFHGHGPKKHYLTSLTEGKFLLISSAPELAFPSRKFG